MIEASRVSTARRQHEEVQAAYEWLSTLMAGFSYHKGWRFGVRLVQVLDIDPGRIAAVVAAEFPNVERPALGLSRQHIDNERDMTVLALARDEVSVNSEVWRMIAEIEAHERCEWFRHDGRPVIDPHPDGILGLPRLAP